MLFEARFTHRSEALLAIASAMVSIPRTVYPSCFVCMECQTTVQRRLFDRSICTQHEHYTEQGTDSAP
jgi:hypothetical protein|eukprot:5350205-Prymnesium_polylepis.2